MALLPPNELLHLGPDPAGASWNHFDLGLGLATHINYPQAQLGNTPPQGAPWFYSKLNSNGVPCVQFSAPLGGATTSTSTAYARSELREYERNGTTKMAFDPTSGDHWIEGIYRITGLGVDKRGLCVQQMHDPSDDVIMVRTENNGSGTGLYLNYNGTRVATLNTSVVVGQEFYLKTRVNAGTPSVYYTTNLAAIPTTPTHTSAGFFSGASTGWYSKTGCYNQSNELTDPSLDPDASIIKLEVRELKHWHSATPAGGAWPTPATYATVGSPTADAGADAQILPSDTFTRTGAVTLNGATLSSQQWKISSGPLGVGNVLSSTASVSWNPNTGTTSSGTTVRGLGVGGIARPAAASNVELNGANRGDMNITASGTALVPRVYDGGGFTCGRVTISADYIIVQNYYIKPNSQYGVYITGSNVTVQNCDIKDIKVSGDGDLNAITLLEGSNIDILYNTAINYVTGDPGDSHTDWIQTWVSSSHSTAVSNVRVIGNKATGPSNPGRNNSIASIHQIIMVESAGRGGNSGGSGTPSNWTILDNEFGDSWGQAIKLDFGNNFVFARNKFVGSSDKVFDFVGGTGNTVYSSNTFGTGYGSVGASTTSGDGPANPISGGSSPVTTPYPKGSYILEYSAVTSAGTVTDTVNVLVTDTPTTPGGGGGGGGGTPGTVAAYPSFVGAGTAATGDSGGSVAVGPPTGITTGQFQICVIQCSAVENMTGVPAGWFLMDEQAVDNTDLGQPGGPSKAWVYYNTTGDNQTRTWTKDGTRGFHAIRMSWKDYSALGQHLTRGSSYTTTPYAPIVDPTTPKALVVTVMGSDRSDIGPQPVSGPSGWTERYDAGPTVSTNEIQTIVVADIQATDMQTTGGNVPGGTGNGTSNFTLTNADNCSMFSFVLEGVLSSGVVTPALSSFSAIPKLTVSSFLPPVPPGGILLTTGQSLLARSFLRGATSLLAAALLQVNPVVFPRGAFIILPNLSVGVTQQQVRAFLELLIQPVLRAGALPYRRPVIRTDYKYPPKSHPFRLIAQRILDGEIVEWELPVDSDFEYVQQLSGPIVMKGSFRPEIISVQELGLDGYAYWLHVEINQEIRASAILLPPQYEESAMSFSAEGVAAAPHYTYYNGTISYPQVDPFSIVRTLWNYVQSQPQSDYGVIVGNNSSPVLLGEPARTETMTEYTGGDNPEKIQAAQLILSRLSTGQPIFEDWTWSGAPPVVGKWNDELLNNAKASGLSGNDWPFSAAAKSWLSNYITTAAVGTPTITVRDIPAKPYEINWWDGTNVGEEIDSLAGQTPFDYMERHAWNLDRTDVLHFIDLGYPRLGTVRKNLLFNEENILEVVPVQEAEDTYASAVLVIGAGDGADTIRAYREQAFADRVRKEVVVTDKTITTQERANARADQELAYRRGRAFEVGEIVTNSYHTNAPVGSYAVGDDIQVQVEVPWLMLIHSAWYRVTSITTKPSSDKVRIGLQRSANILDTSDQWIQPDDYIPFEPTPTGAPTTWKVFISLTVTPSLILGGTLIPALIGGVTLSSGKTLVVGAIALRSGAVSLTVGKTFTAQGVASAPGVSTVSLIINKTISVAAFMSGAAAISMSQAPTLTSSAQTFKIGAVGLAATATLGVQTGVPVAGVSMSVGKALAIGATVQGGAAVTLSAGKTLTVGSSAGTTGAVSMTVTKSLTANGSVTASNVIPQVRNAQAASGAAAGSSAVVTKPTSLAVGDLLIGVAVCDNDGTLAALTGPSWTLQGSQAPAASGQPGLKIWTKIATSVETGSTNFSFSAGTGIFCSAGIMAIIAGTFDPTNPLAGTPVFNFSTSLVTAHVAPSIATGVNNGLLVTAHSVDQGGAATNSYTPPTGMTEQVDTAAASAYTGLEINTLALTSTAATGTKSATCTNSRPFDCASFIVNPASGGSVSGSVLIDSSTPAAVKSETIVASLTTAAFTPPVGSVLLVGAIFDTATSTRTGTPSTVTGATSAWTTIGNFNNGNGTTGGLVHYSWARVTTSQSTTVRITWPASSDCALKVWVLTGVPDTGSPIGVSGSATLSTNPQTASYSATVAGSQGFIAVEDFAQSGAKTISNTTTETTLATNSNGVIARDSSVAATIGQTRSFSISGTPGSAEVAWVEVVPSSTGGGGGGVTTGGSGGPLTDRTSVAYTNTAGTSSTGHIYAAGLDWTKPVGILVYTDGSGEFGLKNPTDTYLLAGTNGLIAKAKAHNMILVTPLAPGVGCDDGDGTCWYDSSGTMTIATKIKWADDFIRSQVLTQYNIDTSRAVIAGYSSGAQFTTEYYGPQYASAWMTGGLLLAISYGGSPKVTANYPTAFKQSVAASWDVGSTDPAYTTTSAFGVQAGYDWYTANGFALTELTVVPGEDHARDGLFGGIVDREISQYVTAV